MNRANFLREVKKIATRFGGTPSFPTAPGAYTFTSSTGMRLRFTAETYRDRATITLDRDYTNPELDRYLLDLLRTNPRHSGGSAGTYWSVHGIRTFTAVQAIPTLLRLDLPLLTQLSTDPTLDLELDNTQGVTR
jgi:hypothetical protein